MSQLSLTPKKKGAFYFLTILFQNSFLNVSTNLFQKLVFNCNVLFKKQSRPRKPRCRGTGASFEKVLSLSQSVDFAFKEYLLFTEDYLLWLMQENLFSPSVT